MKRLTIAGLLLGTLAVWTPPVSADEIVLVTGERRQGRVETAAGSPDRVAFISSVGRLEFPKARIKEILEQDDATDYAILGEQFVKAKSYRTALEMFLKAQEADPTSAAAAEGVERTRALIQEHEAESRRQTIAENSGLLSRAREEIGASKFETAERTLERVLETSPSEEQRAAVELVRRDLYLRWAESRLDKLDPTGAEQYLQKVVAIDPGNKEARDLLLQVWEVDPSRRQEVLAEYQKKLLEAPDDLSLNRKVADLLMQLNRDEEAIGPLVKLRESGQFRAAGYDKRLASALENVANTKAGEGDLNGAIGAYEQLVTLFPETDRSPLTYLQYQRRLDSLKADDWEGRAGLLKDLDAQGLHALAVQEADLILSNAAENKTALAFLRADAEASIAEIQDAMRRGDYYVARDAARSFTTNNKRFRDLIEMASDIYTKADIEAQRQSKRQREQAREIAVRGDEYYNEARRYAEMMKNRETSDRTTVLSYKQEAIKFSKRAIDTYTVALQIDPSLGPVSGMDVTSKLSDSNTLYKSLTAPPIRTRSLTQRGRVANPSSSAN